MPSQRVRIVDAAAMKTMQGFRGRLENEAKTRPEVPIKAEEVLAALEKDGITLERKRQQLASSQHASYCLGTRTGKRIQITVCEYASVEQAEESVKRTQKLERPERRIERLGQLTLLTRRGLNQDEDAPLVDKVFTTFLALGGP